MSPRILALETSGRGGSVAALEGECLLCEVELPAGRRSAQTVAPTISQVLQTAGWKPGKVQLVAVAHGPGSFTGLRIGVTTTKAFAYAVGAELLGVCTLEAIASAVVATNARLEVVIDAHRRQLFSGSFALRPAGDYVPTSPPRVVDIEWWLSQLLPHTAAAGPGLSLLAGRIPEGVHVVAESHWEPRAAQVGRLAARKHALGERGDVWRLAPVYLRPSAAEEKRAAEESVTGADSNA